MTRKVFGRLTAQFDGETFWIEMRKDGIYVRQKHHQQEFKINLSEILRLGRRQTLLFECKPTSETEEK